MCGKLADPKCPYQNESYFAIMRSSGDPWVAGRTDLGVGPSIAVPEMQKHWEAVMAWVGRTNFSEIGVGTSLRLEEIPTIPGRSPSPVRARSKIDIEMAAGVRTKATIVSVADNEIQMKLPDGTVWQMTHRTPFDPPVEIKSPGLNQQDWVVRSARPFALSGRGR
jgi:hypothetical protein